MMTTDTSPLAFRSRTRSRMIAPSLAPIAASGSSSSRIFAFECTARATAIACRCPPDSAATSDSTDGMLIPTSSRYCRASRFIVRLDSSGQRTFSRFRNMLWYTLSWFTRARSWYTTSMPSDRAWSTDLNVTSWPSSRIRPESGGWKPHRIFSRVDLPAPLSPSRPSTSPRASRRLMSAARSPRRSACRCARPAARRAPRPAGRPPAAPLLPVKTVPPCRRCRSSPDPPFAAQPR